MDWYIHSVHFRALTRSLRFGHVWVIHMQIKMFLDCRLQICLFLFSVVTMAGNHCTVGSEVSVSNHSHGMLASIITHETGCGVRYRPWVIEVKISQRINLTLYDFSTMDISLSIQSPCPAYITVREDATGEANYICGKAQRVSHVYTSLSNKIQIELDLAQSHPSVSFAVAYEGGSQAVSLSIMHYCQVMYFDNRSKLILEFCQSRNLMKIQQHNVYLVYIQTDTLCAKYHECENKSAWHLFPYLWQP